MQTFRGRLLAGLLILVAVPCAFAGEWDRLSSLPNREGFAGSFAGVSGGVLMVAGGANFPDKKPWEGGKKIWYDSVFVLAKETGQWVVGGKMPRPLGYGVCVVHGDGVVCVGGSDAERHYADVFRLSWNNGKLVTTNLPPLPNPLANGCGAVVGDTLYIAGGQEKPDSTKGSKRAWRLDLSVVEPKWEAIDDCPGDGRILAIAAGLDGAFWVVGGVDLLVSKDGKVKRHYRTDAYRYTPGKGWQRIADLDYPVAAAPSPAPSDASGFYILGGDDGDQIDASPDKHRGFGKKIQRYDLKTSKWIEVGEQPAPRVTVPLVIWNNAWIVPSGEMRPGVRSPEVWRFKPEMKD